MLTHAWLFTPAQTHACNKHSFLYASLCCIYAHCVSVVCVCVRRHTNMLSYSNFHSSPSTHTHTLISLFFKETGIFRPLRWRELWWISYKWCWVFKTCTRDQQHLLLHFTKTCWLIFHPKIERKIRNYILRWKVGL